MTDDYLWFDGVSEQTIKKERARARELRRTRWWQQKTASGACYYCGQVVRHSELTMDHLVPLSRGGCSTRDNLVPSCKECNTRKKTMLPVEWEEYINKKTE